MRDRWTCGWARPRDISVGARRDRARLDVACGCAGDSGDVGTKFLHLLGTTTCHATLQAGARRAEDRGDLHARTDAGVPIRQHRDDARGACGYGGTGRDLGDAAPVAISSRCSRGRVGAQLTSLSSDSGLVVGAIRKMGVGALPPPSWHSTAASSGQHRLSRRGEGEEHLRQTLAEIMHHRAMAMGVARAALDRRALAGERRSSASRSPLSCDPDQLADMATTSRRRCAVRYAAWQRQRRPHHRRRRWRSCSRRGRGAHLRPCGAGARVYDMRWSIRCQRTCANCASR